MAPSGFTSGPEDLKSAEVWKPFKKLRAELKTLSPPVSDERPLSLWRWGPTLRWRSPPGCSRSHKWAVCGSEQGMMGTYIIGFLAGTNGKRMRRSAPVFVADEDLMEVEGVSVQDGILQINHQALVEFHQILRLTETKRDGLNTRISSRGSDLQQDLRGCWRKLFQFQLQRRTSSVDSGNTEERSEKNKNAGITLDSSVISRFQIKSLASEQLVCSFHEIFSKTQSPDLLLSVSVRLKKWRCTLRGRLYLLDGLQSLRVSLLCLLDLREAAAANIHLRLLLQRQASGWDCRQTSAQWSLSRTLEHFWPSQKTVVNFVSHPNFLIWIVMENSLENLCRALNLLKTPSNEVKWFLLFTWILRLAVSRIS